MGTGIKKKPRLHDSARGEARETHSEWWRSLATCGRSGRPSNKKTTDAATTKSDGYYMYSARNMLPGIAPEESGTEAPRGLNLLVKWAQQLMPGLREAWYG